MHFRLRDTLVLAIALATLFALAMPAFVNLREAARQMQCSNNLRQIGLAIHNYQATYKVMPCAMGGTDGAPQVSNAGSISGFVGLMPFLEDSPFFSDLMEGVPAGGTAPWIAGQTKTRFWDMSFPMFRCPSERTSRPKLGEYGPTNYAFCWGDSVASILDQPHTSLPTRGPFQSHAYKRFEDVTDGLANTIGFGEIAMRSHNPRHGVVAIVQNIEMNPALCLAQFDRVQFTKGTAFVQSDQRRGGRWCDGRPYYSGFTTVLPPNAISCTSTDNDGTWGIFSASSNHRNMVQCAFLDATVRKISNSVDCGLVTSRPPDEAQRTGVKLPSPFGAWGAMGTISSGETSHAEE